MTPSHTTESFSSQIGDATLDIVVVSVHCLPKMPFSHSSQWNSFISALRGELIMTLKPIYGWSSGVFGQSYQTKDGSIRWSGHPTLGGIAYFFLLDMNIMKAEGPQILGLPVEKLNCGPSSRMMLGL